MQSLTGQLSNTHIHQVTWEDGLRNTVEWYRQYAYRYGDLESVLVAHPTSGKSGEMAFV